MTARKPLIGISANLTEAPFRARRRTLHAAGERNVEAVLRMVDCVPVLLPPVGLQVEVADTVAHLDGVILTGGRANVEPHHYGGPPFPEDEPIDPGRDALVLALVNVCIEAEVPVFGICRGIQEMNVALGGTLHYRLHVLDDFEDHRMPRHDDVTDEEIFRLNHTVTLSDGGLFQALVGQREVMVNSLHGQGIERLADRLAVEAVSPDGVIEGVRLKDDPGFTVGVQWHAEWKPEGHLLSGALYEAFGEAARQRCVRRHGGG